MVTQKKRWPNNADWARLDSIALADQSWQILDSLLDELANVHQVRQVGRAMSGLREIRFKLTVCKDENTNDEE